MGPPSLVVSGPCADIYLNRPACHNCLNNADIAIFQQHLKEIDVAPAIRVLTLAASGSTFCSGYDLRELRSGSSEGAPRFDVLVGQLAKIRVPSVCAVSGGIYGGGTDLALACDFRIGTPQATFAIPASRIGVHYYYGGLERFVRRLGLSTAKQLFLLGGTIKAEEMLRLGILDEIVVADQLATRAQVLAVALAANAPLAVQGMKFILDRIAEGGSESRLADAAWHASLQSDDLTEGLAALAEKRVPRFADKAFCEPRE